MPTQRIGFHVVLVLATLAFIAIVLPFYSAILWAVVLAILFHPVHAWLDRKLGQRSNLAAAISVVMCLCLVIVPGMIMLGQLVQQGTLLYQNIQSGQIDIRQILQDLENALPAFVRERLASLTSIDSTALADLRQRVSSALLQGGGFIASRALSIGQNTLSFVLTFGLMLYLLFFMFRDGRRLAATVRRALPLSDDHTNQLADKFTAVVRATVRGSVVIAAIQGTIGGIAFWALGIKAALLWGFAMAILSLLPAVGAAVVWVPAAIYLLASGFWGKAVILVAIGVLVIGLVDNLLRPPLVGRESKLPDYVVLISTLGGLSLLGINGFVIGPLVAAIFIAIWSIFATEQT